MNAVCELEDFFINQLQVDWLRPDPNRKEESVSFGFDYDLSWHNENPHRVRMIMRFVMGANKQEENSSCPYGIKAEVEGFFKFSEDIDDQKMAYLCRVNSLTILYGILRGEIANVTGSFRDGKFILPTVMMQDVVKDVEARKEANRKKAQADTVEAE